jgi:adenine phosphoribosyltransferase
MSIKSLIRSIPDYPKKGVIFRDITTLLQDPSGFRRAVDELVQPFAGSSVHCVAGIEARGFILGTQKRKTTLANHVGPIPVGIRQR